MNEQALRLMLIEDNPGDVRLLRVYLQEVRSALYQVVHFARLDEALASLDYDTVSIILLDLSLPDSEGLDTLHRVVAVTEDVPIIILTGTDDEHLAINALQIGAQDYLVKGQIDSNVLVRSMRYAIERQRMQASLRSLSLTDDLTGLYNRRGFLTLAEHHCKVARRSHKPFLLVYLDIDGMKTINDSLGHHAGDIALLEAASLLRETFRESDILARMGGDEFVVIVLDSTQEEPNTLTQRLLAAIDARNHAAAGPQLPFSMSIGTAEFHPDAPEPIEALLDQADSLMYEMKRQKKQLADVETA